MKHNLSIVVAGETNTGKSRMIYALKEHLRAQGFNVVLEPSIDYLTEEAFDGAVQFELDKILADIKENTVITLRERTINRPLTDMCCCETPPPTEMCPACNCSEEFTLFYDGVFSNWYPAAFKDFKGMKFNCVEQYMMYNKAMLFGDKETAAKIMVEPHPRQQKALGKTVQMFNKEYWEHHARNIVYRGNHYKFAQNPELMQALMATKGTTLVECSLEDKIWGIGMYESDPDCRDRSKWKGTNWLGETLTKLRTDYENNTLFSKVNLPV
jgi:ribA/ribD-fused uncharacterized protein